MCHVESLLMSSLFLAGLSRLVATAVFFFATSLSLAGRSRDSSLQVESNLEVDIESRPRKPEQSSVAQRISS